MIIKQGLGNIRANRTRLLIGGKNAAHATFDDFSSFMHTVKEELLVSERKKMDALSRIGCSL
jgi:hypothetical protein